MSMNWLSSYRRFQPSVACFRQNGERTLFRRLFAVNSLTQKGLGRFALGRTGGNRRRSLSTRRLSGSKRRYAPLGADFAR